MASVLRFSPAPRIVCFRRQAASGRPAEVRCEGRSPAPASREGPKSENVVLKLAWYGSELLGIAASLFRSSPPTAPAEEVSTGEIGSLTSRAQVAEAIKEDFARSYFVTGNLTLIAYEDDCEFADPAGSFRGLRRFKRNCSNFGSLLEKSNMKLTKWEDFELSSSFRVDTFVYLSNITAKVVDLRINQLDIGVSVASCHFLGDQFFPLLAIQNTISILNQGGFAGMWSIGMFQKWHFLSKYSDQAAGYGRLAERLQSMQRSIRRAMRNLRKAVPWHVLSGL